MNKLLVFLLFSTTLLADHIDVVSNFFHEFPVTLTHLKQEGFNIRSLELSEYLKSPLSPQTRKIIVFNYFQNTYELSVLPKEKLTLFLWEAVDPHPFYELFSRVYTWNDNLVDRVKFFKFYYPYLMPMHTDLPAFEAKKLCTMIASHFTSERIAMIDFFATKLRGDFEFYGRPESHLTNLIRHPMYRGSIPGGHSDNPKIATLKRYRFCICFENCHIHRGYITEKIFGCFAAGCVPVYWGAPNIQDYIPKECFIDYRDFQSHDELYRFLKTMPKQKYEQYLDAIRSYLNSDKAKLFSLTNFEDILYDAATH